MLSPHQSLYFANRVLSFTFDLSPPPLCVIIFYPFPYVVCVRIYVPCSCTYSTPIFLSLPLCVYFSLSRCICVPVRVWICKYCKFVFDVLYSTKPQIDGTPPRNRIDSTYMKFNYERDQGSWKDTDSVRATFIPVSTIRFSCRTCFAFFYETVCTCLNLNRNCIIVIRLYPMKIHIFLSLNIRGDGMCSQWG